MNSINSVTLAGHISDLDVRDFGEFKLAMFMIEPPGDQRIRVTLKSPKDNFLALMERKSWAILNNAYLDSRQDKKNPDKWYYNLAVNSAGVLLLDRGPDEGWVAGLNQATFLGEVVHQDGSLLMVRETYRYTNPKTRANVDGERFIHVLCSLDLSNTQLLGRRVWGSGRVRPMLGQQFLTHIQANVLAPN